MGQLLDALLALQTIETRLAQLRGRLRSRRRAAEAQLKKIEQLTKQQQELHDLHLLKRSQADEADLELKALEGDIAKLREQLNTARTNKEYAALLTQLNTFRADNSKIEEDALNAMGRVDEIKAQLDETVGVIETENARLAQVEAANADEIGRLEAMIAEVQAQRDAAAGQLSERVLSIFDRLVASYDGEAMAMIEQEGAKEPFTYVCGGCFMSLNAEHVNALHKFDDIRTCDNCGRILYLDAAAVADD
jgi:predicted  nucleic acid-binding Zn-ribbon protein